MRYPVIALAYSLPPRFLVLGLVLLPCVLHAQESSAPTPNGRGVLVAVLKSARLIGEATSAQYPDALKGSKAEGEVVIRFLVQPTGEVSRDSMRIVSATDQLFVDATRTALVRRRYSPALQDGRPVPQWIQERFVFRPPSTLKPPKPAAT